MSVELNSRCKICNLLKVNERIWVDIHNKVLEDGLSNSAVCKWLNSVVDVHNKNSKTLLVKFNNANFTNHFKNHISSSDMMKKELKKWISSKPKIENASFDDKQKAIAGSVSPPPSDKSSYERISNMIDIMEENLDAYSNNIKNKRDKKGINSYINPIEIEKYNKFVSDLIAAKQNLLKLKNSEQTTMMAVEAVVEFMIMGFANKILDLSEEIKNVLDAEFKGETSLPKQISETIKSKLIDDMESLVKETTDMIKRDYGVK